MSMHLLLALVMITPLATAIIIYFLPNNFSTLSIFHVIGSFATSIIAFYAISNVIHGGIYFLWDELFFLDSVGGVFLALIALTGLLINLYAVKYMQWDLEEGKIKIKDVKLYYSLMNLFIFTMITSVVANNIAIMWAAIEATTLSSVFMVALYKNKRATESGWKYIIICSVGLAFALYATVLMYGAGYHALKNGESAMLWTSLYTNAKLLDPSALKLIFVFALIGFGTKAGLAPMHTWLPDVHSEGPSPTSAILSAVLLKCAILAIVRYYSVIGENVGFTYVQILTLVVSLLSIFIAAMFIIRQKDIKRMFAYHSVEHVGIIAFGFGIGGPLGVFAGLFHTMAHSLSKALAFCVSGNIMKIYGTRDMDKMGGLMKINPLTAVLFAIAIFSLIGAPLLAVFVSEFLMVKASIMTTQYLPVFLFVVGLGIIVIGVLAHFNHVVFGKPRGEVKTQTLGANAHLPLIVLGALIIAFGVFYIQDWYLLLDNAVKNILHI
ncbi:hydrogenase 4 subunit F [Lebetimonas sp. JH292]|uniref:hydrogenase 4 subunit F n=1 Tax=Lebetimonas sp. JH292 TaxID=990068 RepID=UPI0004AE6F35|nr:hydrogenase 4 subunit F [Lebetimonas sp. JH292]